MSEAIKYTVQSGADKKRKRDAETEYWNSLNGPVTVKKIEVFKNGK